MILVAAGAAAWATCVGGTLLAARCAVVAALVALIVGVLLWATHRIGLAGVASAVVIAAGSCAWHVAALHRGPVPRIAATNGDAELIVRLVRDPVPVTTSTGARMTVTDATAIRIFAAGWQQVSSPLVVFAFGSSWRDLLPGQRVDVSGRLTTPDAHDDVAAYLDARGPPLLVGQPPWWQRAAGHVRQSLRSAAGPLPDNERGLLPGLVDGDTSGMPPPLTADMRLTGLTHLQAVSGENVTVVLMVAAAVAAGLGMRRRLKVVLCGTMLVSFVILARPSPSVLRAAVMGAIVLAGMATGRRGSALPALSASVLLLVVVDPFLARSVGFALSVLATGSLITLAPPMTRWLQRRMPRVLAVAIAVPTAAQLACLPVLVLAFGRATPYAVPANLLAGPAVAPATIVGVVAAAVASVSVGLATPLMWIAAAPTYAIATSARLLAAAPGAAMGWPDGPVGVVLALLIGGCVAGAAVFGVRRKASLRPHESLSGWP